MPAINASPYLFFNGTAKAAIRLYESALGVKVEGLMHYGDKQVGGCPDADRDRVVHAALRLGNSLIMLSDAPNSMPAPAESNVSVALEYTDVEEMTKAFDALAASGKIQMKLHDAFWGAKFGAVVDSFGISWMLSCPLKKPDQQAQKKD